MATILDEILTQKRQEIAAARQNRPAAELRAAIADAPPIRDFTAALRHSNRVGLIAEVKKASPSAGLIRDDFEPVAIARQYEAAGADCLSVLTDEKFFQGHLSFLTSIRQAVSTPLMRKEFVLDEYQILEARVAGADCVLLIAECLEDDTLRRLYDGICELGMQALIETHDPENLDRVLALNSPLIGVNNRDLRTFETSLNQTFGLMHRIPGDVVLVSESGIRTNDDVRRLHKAGVGAILVGESLMRQDDIATAVRALMQDSID